MKNQPTINIYNQDCMEAMADMEDNAFELAIIDPPYGIDRNNQQMGNSAINKDQKRWDKKTPKRKLFEEIFRVSQNQIIWGGNNFNLPPSRYFAIWDKGETMYGRDFAEAEFAWASNGGTRIFKKSPNQKERIHPTQKPVALYKWLLKNYANEGDKILDTHLGSGSIAIACHDMGFKLEAYEIDQEYYQAALQRLNTHRSQLQMF